MRDWPVVVTSRCAEACANQFGLSHVAPAREWLYTVIRQRGKVTSELPVAAPKLRSRSGYFMVANDVVVLPLMASSDGTARWIATDCAVLPGYRRRYVASGDVDPHRLTGADLVRHIDLTQQAVAEFQRHCGGNRHYEIARDELRQILGRDARAVSGAPEWYQAPTDPTTADPKTADPTTVDTAVKSDFHLLAGDGYALPVLRRRNGRFSFAAMGCAHRAGELFRLRDADLTACCRFDAATLRIEPSRWDRFVAAASEGGRLSWHRPRWARSHPRSRFWVVASPSLAAPVAWQRCNDDRPLLILDIQDRRALGDRVARWLPGGRHHPQ